MPILYNDNTLKWVVALTGSSLANGFIVLARKPMVLLLLFPFQALAPMFLLFMPLLTQVSDDETTVLLKMLLALGLAAVFCIAALARVCLLVPPAVELLRDGAAGVETPPGWFRRGLGRHWWKRLAIALTEWSVSSTVSLFAQIAINIVSVPILLISVPLLSGEAESGFVYLAGLMLLIYGIIGVICLVLLVFQFIMECYGAYLLPALADRGFSAAFKTVFGRAGAGRLAKLVGGRFLVGIVSFVFTCAVLVGLVLALGAGSAIHIEDEFSTLAFFSVALSVCVFVSSYLSVYRNAFEFCVFQEIRDEEAKRGESARMALTKKGE